MLALVRIILFAVGFLLLGRILRRVASGSRQSRDHGDRQERPPVGNPSPNGHGASNGHQQSPTKSPYEVLEIAPEATKEEIRAAYRRKVQQYHPDKVVELGPEIREVADRRMKEINAAYAELKRRHGM